MGDQLKCSICFSSSRLTNSDIFNLRFEDNQICGLGALSDFDVWFEDTSPTPLPMSHLNCDKTYGKQIHSDKILFDQGPAIATF